MPRITPVHWKVLECIFKKAGYEFTHQVGSHRHYTRKGVLRPVIIPAYKEIDVTIIKSNMRSAHMTRDEYFDYLRLCK